MMESGRIAVSLRPVKLPRLDSDSCLCHSGSDNLKSEPLAVFSERNWKTFLHAANIHRDNTYSFLSENDTDPAVLRGVYHCIYYQAYTHKRQLERLAEECAEESSTTDLTDTSSSNLESCSSQADIEPSSAESSG